MKKRLLASVLSVMFVNCVHAGSAGGFGGATEITQIMNNAELGASTGELMVQTASAAERTLTQINQLNYIKQRLNSNGPWYTKALAIVDLRRVVMQGQGIAAGSGNAAIDAANKFLDYAARCGSTVSYGATSKSPYGAIGAAKCSGNEFKKWQQVNRDTIKNTIEANDLSASKFETEESTLAYLDSLNNNVSGQTEVAQVGNRVAMEQVKQMQELRKMQLAQSNAINATMMSNNQEKEDKGEIHRGLFESDYQQGENVRYFKPGRN